jgi:parallel beta-helix repeat protein
MPGIAQGPVVESMEPRFLLTAYFVRPDGSDQNLGDADTSAGAWLTLQRAANQALNPGDTVRVRAGHYAGMNLYNKAGGTAASPISFLADANVFVEAPGTGQNSQYAYINIENGAAAEGRFVIQGFTMTGGGEKAGIRSALSQNNVFRNNMVSGAFTGIFAGRSDGILIEDNTCHDNWGEHGIYVSGTANYIIRHNTCYKNNWNGIHTNVADGTNQINTGGLIENNLIRNNGLSGAGAGIDLDGMNNSVVRNNLVYNNQTHAIVLHNGNQSPTVACHDVEIVNNTLDALRGEPANAWAIKMAPLSPQPAGSPWTGNDNWVTVFNNILLGRVGSGTGSIGNVGYANKNFHSDYNVVVDSFQRDSFWKNLASWRLQRQDDVHSVISTAADLFVYYNPNETPDEPESGRSNYHLKAGAVAVNLGVASFESDPAPTLDFEGQPRPQGSGFDAGYDELI